MNAICPEWFTLSRSLKQLGYSLEQLKVALAHTEIATTEGYVQQTVPVSQVVMTLPPRSKE